MVYCSSTTMSFYLTLDSHRMGVGKNIYVVEIIYLDSKIANEIVTSYLYGEKVCFCRSVVRKVCTK